MQQATRRREYWLDKPEEYWARFTHGGFLMVEGWPIQIPGLGEMDLFLMESASGWYVVEGACGIAYTDQRNVTTPEGAMRATERYLVDQFGQDRRKLAASIRRNIGQTGLSPRYREDDDE